jgi:hypothetical protein
MKVIGYTVTLLIAILPIATIFQGALCGIASRIFVAKEERIVAFYEWPWPLKVLSFLVAFAFWFGISRLWIVVLGQQMPVVLSGVVCASIALFTRMTRKEMTYIFRTNRTNEGYASLGLFVYLLFFTDDRVML